MRAGRSTLAILALAALAPFPAARGADREPIGLDEAVQRAQAASADLRRLEALRGAAEAGSRAALAGARPSVDLLAGYTRRSDVPPLAITLPDGSDRTLFPNIPDNYRTRLELSYPLYTGGRTRGAIDAARQQAVAAAHDLEQGTHDLVLETVQAYWTLVTARDTARVLSEAMASFEAHLKDAGERERQGLAAHNEVLAVQVERDRAELARLRAENLAHIADADLARLLDLPPGTEVQPTEPLDRPVAPGEDTAKLIEEAFAARPERAALQARIAAAEAETRGAASGHRPRIELSAGYEYDRPNRLILPPEDRWDDTWDLSLNLSFRLLDGGRTAALVSESGGRAAALRWQLEDLDRRIRVEVLSRAADLETAFKGVSVAEANLQAATDNLRIARDRYHAGVIPSSDLLDSETALLNSSLDRTEALTALQLARARLDRAAGR
jgi:outer membrane protein